MEAHSPLLPVAQKQAMIYDETVRNAKTTYLKVHEHSYREK
jgi:hypothetical protein